MWEAWEKSPEKQLPMGKLNIEEKGKLKKCLRYNSTLCFVVESFTLI
jgi:hypothetical protein